MKKTGIFMLCLFIPAIASAQQYVSKNLSDTIVGLQEVVVTKKLVKYEKGKYMVDTKMLRKGKTNLVDLLSDVPGLIVDENSISVPGKDGVRVMFNGRVKNIPQSQLVEILKSYKASNVVRVEIMREPGAKYAAEGNHGMINIVTERHNDYIGGEVSDVLTYSEKWKNTSRLNLNLSSGRITSSLNAGWTYGKNKYEESNVYYFDNITRKNFSDYVAKDNNYNLRYNLDIDVDSLSVVGVEVQYSDALKKLGSIEETFSCAAVGQTETTASKSQRHNPYSNLNANIYADRKWGNGSKVTFSADLFRLNNDRDYMFHSDIFDSNQKPAGDEEVSNSGTSHLKGVSAQMDYDAILPWNINLSVGASMSLTNTDNNSHYDYSTLPNDDDTFKYTENIYAAYAMLSYDVKKWGFRMGARYEHTHTNGESQTTGTSSAHDYGRLFPDLCIDYKTGGGGVISLSSNSGITRPSLRALNPFIAYSSPYTAACGNPTLKASHWFNIRLTNYLPFKGGDITNIVTFYKGYDGIEQTTRMDNDSGVAMSQWRNSYNETSWIYNLMFNYRQIRWMKIFFVASVTGQKSNPLEQYGRQVGYRWYSNFNSRFRFLFDKSGNFTGYLTARYSGRSENAIGVLKDIVNIGAGLGYSMMANHLNLTVSASNIISSNVRGTTYANNGMTMTFNNHFSPFSVTLGCSYRFGKSIRGKIKTRSSDDVIKRF